MASGQREVKRQNELRAFLAKIQLPHIIPIPRGGTTVFGVTNDSETRKRPFWQELSILVVVALAVAALVVNFIGRPYLIPSESMEPTLHGCTGCTGDRIYVEKIDYYLHDPRPGDVVVFVAPTSSWNSHYRGSTRSRNVVLRGIEDFLSIFGLTPPDENDLVKRVIAVGGQTVQCCDAQGRVLVDGKPLDEPYLAPTPPFDPHSFHAATDLAHRPFGPVKVPPGNVWVMGDNRAHSADSRFHMNDEFQGTVPISDIRGRAVFKIWPPTRIGPVTHP
ncbi:signal peptidase I [Nocardia terpenica]|uniref:Signal peptidase I n=2 Tax=Nocardia terpenica TaxID=455432 RepID=A0A291RF99_9NOCA|nr:signal peptidase I [Nocardia terpenica]